jgi:DNA-binding LacI/PurR family transcriptional regulator
MTLGAMMAIKEYNIKIPDEISIIGFDYFEMTKLILPRLTIVSQPMNEIGREAAQILLRRLRQDKKGFPSLIRLKTEFIMGDSIKKLH